MHNYSSPLTGHKAIQRLLKAPKAPRTNWKRVGLELFILMAFIIPITILVYGSAG